MKFTLPDKPSELLSIALEDLEKCEAQPDKFRINMSDWVERNGHCSVCLAGALIVQRGGIRDNEDFDDWLNEQPLSVKNKIFAINELRLGYVGSGIAQFMGLRKPSELPNYVGVATYRDDPIAFNRDMRNLIARLAEHGL